MMQPWEEIEGPAHARLLLIGDHASNVVPPGVDLGVDAALMDQHVAIDIGVAPLARALCTALDCPGVLGGVSRLVIDLNREEAAEGLIPERSDGHVIHGNVGLEPAERGRRLRDYWAPYHHRIADRIAAIQPKMLISLHSFTPCLATSDEPRPWQVGILYNQDERAARIALPLLEATGITAGDNFPYSGKVLNATMNHHGEANRIAYLGIEMRQDLIADDAGVAIWAARLAPIIAATVERLDG
jgi:predicted N-formylglutamate amidohydrolase